VGKDDGCSSVAVGSWQRTDHGQDRRSLPQAQQTTDSGLSYWRLGSCEGLIEVGSHLGHDLLDAADRRLPAAFATGVTLAGFGWGRGPDDDLMPGDLLVDEDGHSHLQSVGDGRTYLLGKLLTQISRSGQLCDPSRSACSARLGVGDGRNTLVRSAVLVGEVLP
jgi:hypothetical protein